MDILRTRRFAWAWRYAGVQEAGDLGNGPNVVPAWHRYWLVLGAIGKGDGVRNTDHVCKNAGARTWARMGSCVWCHWAGLLCCHGTVLCRGGGALGSSGARMHAEGLNRVGRTVYGCVYLCTQSALGRTGFRRHRRRDRLAVDVGDQDSRGHRRARAKYLKTENVWGVEETAANKGSLRLQHFIFYLDIAIVCCWAVCGLSTCAIYRQGSTWTNTAPTRFNVGLLVEAGDGGGGALVPGSGSWTLFLFFSALWGKATSR